MNDGDIVIKLDNGQRIGIREFGDPNGYPLFYFHGWPASRLHGVETHKAAVRLKIRVIAPDRPGYGLSDFQPGRSFLDWAGDVSEIADRLNIQKFSVMGVSGGAPYAAACAYALPDRVHKAGIVVGLAPVYLRELTGNMSWFSRFGWNNYQRFPVLKYLSSGLLGLGYKFIPLVFLRTGMSSPADVALINSSLKSRFKSICFEAFRQGVAGPAHDLHLYSKDWGFSLKKIKVPVYLWYGARDKTVPLVMGEYYQKLIPQSKLYVDKNGGHLSRNLYEEKLLEKLCH